MEHQYPGAISGDENMLAELMLPDQVHNRKEDWTIFFLHKDASEEEGLLNDDSAKKWGGPKDDPQADRGQENKVTAGETSVTETDGEEQQDDAQGGEGPPLIYVLNLVNTKHDASVKRCVLTQSWLRVLLSDPWFWQRCRGKSNGNMHSTFFSSYIQGKRHPVLAPQLTAKVIAEVDCDEAPFIISP